jgi:flagellar biogenesis protein FliO
MECAVKVYQILFILWAIVFAFWLVRQFAEHNKRKDK